MYKKTYSNMADILINIQHYLTPHCHEYFLHMNTHFVCCRMSFPSTATNFSNSWSAIDSNWSQRPIWINHTTKDLYTADEQITYNTIQDVTKVFWRSLVYNMILHVESSTCGILYSLISSMSGWLIVIHLFPCADVPSRNYSLTLIPDSYNSRLP